MSNDQFKPDEMNELLKAALIGTSSHPVVHLADSGAESELLSNRSHDTSEDQLLLRVAISDLQMRAGYLASEVSSNLTAPDEEKAEGERSWVPSIQAVLESRNPFLIREAAELLVAANRIVPREVLPNLLDQTDAEVRKAILPVMGNRARWLSRYQQRWSWLEALENVEPQTLEDLTRIWEEGDFSERIQALKVIRQISPSSGRELLESAFKKEKADQRLQFLEQMQVGISLDDESFLTLVLKDRSDIVRQAASRLLCYLPDSAVALKIREIADSLLKVVQDRKSNFKLTGEWPEAVSEELIAIGVCSQRASSSLRLSRIGHLILRAVPPDYWERKFQKSPSELIAAVRFDDDENMILEAWSEAAIRFASTFPDCEKWLRPLWNYWALRDSLKQTQKVTHSEWLVPLSNALVEEDLQRALLELFRAVPDPAEIPVGALLPASPRVWSLPFSKEYLSATRALLGKRSDTAIHRWTESLKEAAIRLHPECLADALKPWSLKQETENFWSTARLERALMEFGDQVRMRHQLRELILSSAP